jgi:acetamidase/formamidase
MRRIFVACVVFLTSATFITAQSRTYDLKLEPKNVHWGYYDAKIPPVLRIASGDTVRVETMVAGGLERLRLAGIKEGEIPESLKVIENTIKERGPGAHPMSGPIYVEGAQPGDTLEVRFVSFEFLHPFGVTAFSPGGGTLPDEFPYAGLKVIRFNEKAGTGDFGGGITLKLAPFFGSIGVAPPPLMGRISSRPPGPQVGNLDNKDLVAGTTLYMPVHVPGALLSIGDGHGGQGDGEVSGTAMETSLRGTIQIFVRKGKKTVWPRAETPTHYITMGLNEDLDEAARMAVREMIDFLVTEKGMKRDDAYILCSVAGDMRVTQTVDQTKGVHMMIAKSLFR